MSPADRVPDPVPDPVLDRVRWLVDLTDDELGALHGPQHGAVLLPTLVGPDDPARAAHRVALRGLAARGLIALTQLADGALDVEPFETLADLLLVREAPEALLVVHRVRTRPEGADALLRYVFAAGPLVLLEDVNAIGIHRFGTAARAALPGLLTEFLAADAPPVPACVACDGWPAALEMADEDHEALLGRSLVVADVVARPPGASGPDPTDVAHALFVLPGATYVGEAPIGERPGRLRRVDEEVGAFVAELMAGLPSGIACATIDSMNGRDRA
ncbi:MAG: hypothetical protein ABI746_04195 [Dermatophilaceae bacterium]